MADQTLGFIADEAVLSAWHAGASGDVRFIVDSLVSEVEPSETGECSFDGAGDGWLGTGSAGVVFVLEAAEGAEAMGAVEEHGAVA